MIHSTCSPTDFIFIIFESGGKGSLFCNGKKRRRFYSAQPNDASLGGRVVGIKLRFGSVGINLTMHPFGSVLLSSRWNQAPARLKVPLRSMCCWNLRRKHKHPFQICEQSQPKRRQMNQTDAGRTEDRANQKGEKKPNLCG